MPLPIAHGLLGSTIVAALHPKPSSRSYFPLVIGAFLAIAADFDFGFSVFLGWQGWHRGFTHSLFFALFFTLFLVISGGRNNLRQSVAFGLAYASHCVLDFSTTKIGNGLELLFPFTTQRYGLRWIGFSEMPSALSAVEILGTLGLEFLIFAPLLVLVLWLRSPAKQ